MRPRGRRRGAGRCASTWLAATSCRCGPRGGARVPHEFVPAARPEREDAMLVIEQRALEATRTPENSCAWLATCAIGGRRFEARSRRGAPAALARLLVAAAIPDQPVEVHALMLGRWYRPALRYRSLYALAAMTWEEGAATPLRRARYKPRQTSPLAVGAGTTWGVKRRCRYLRPRQPFRASTAVPAPKKRTPRPPRCRNQPHGKKNRPPRRRPRPAQKPGFNGKRRCERT